MSINAIFLNVASLGFKQSIVLFIKKDSYKFDSILNLIFTISILSTILIAIILYIIGFKYELTLGVLGFKTIIILLLFFITELIISFLFSSVLGLNLYKTYSIGFSVNSIIHIILLVYLFFISIINLDNLMIILLLKNILVLLFLTIKVSKFFKFKVRLDFNLYFEMLKEGFIYSLALLILSLIYNSDIIILKLLDIDVDELGIYALTSKIVQGLCILPQSIGTIFFSLSTKKDYPANVKSKIIIFKLFLYILIVLLLILYFFMPEIINLVLGSAYDKSFDIFILLIPGICGLFIIKTLYPDLAGQGEVKPFIKFFIFISLFHIILNYVLILEYSINGCAIACSISYFLLGLFILKKYLKHYSIKLKQLFILSFNDIRLVLNKNTIFNFF